MLIGACEMAIGVLVFHDWVSGRVDKVWQHAMRRGLGRVEGRVKRDPSSRDPCDARVSTNVIMPS